MAYLELKRSAQSVYVEGRTQGYRFTVEVIEAQGISDKIFVYLRKIINGEIFDEFTNIASPADLAEYPADEPVEAIGTPPFFRLNAIDLVFRTEDLAEDAWIQIQQDCAQLIQSTNYMNNLDIEETVSFGEETSSSDSSSSS